MRIGINLATQPFRRDRPVVVLSTVVGAALLGLLGVLIDIGVNQSGQLAESRNNVAQLQSRIKAVSVEQAKFDAVLRRPENAEVLERSLFLNEILLRKGISWTRILEDLEKVVPHNVRIISIRPTVNSRNQVMLDMQVGAETQAPVIALLKAL
jgi:type IV pilus assembly protein PilN